MTRLSNTSSGTNPTKTGRTRTTKTKIVSPADKWDPTKPFHVTQEEFWEHIHEIERGPFMTLEECFVKFDEWKKEFLRNRL